MDDGSVARQFAAADRWTGAGQFLHAGLNVYLLWNHEQKMTRAESVFLERFEQMLMTTDVAGRF
jgi:hypothetical protein